MTTLDDDDDFPVDDNNFWDEFDRIAAAASTQRHPPPPPQTFPATTTTTTATTTTTSAMPLPRRTVLSSVRASNHRERSVGGGYADYGDCFSPPPELSQRPVESKVSMCGVEGGGEVERTSSGQDEGIESIKEESKHLSKKLFDMTKSIAGSDGEDYSMVPMRSENQNTLSRNVNLQIKAHRTIGIQTDEDEDCAGPAPKDDVLLASDLQKRLLSVWSSKSKNSGKSFIAKLLEKCSSEFFALFGFLGSNMTSGMLKIPDLLQASYVKSINNLRLHSSETSEVSKLYAVLTEVGDDAVPLQALLEVLLSLCSLQKVVVVHRSLQILHAVLDLLLPTEKSCRGRDNVKVQGLQIGSRVADSLGFKGAGQDGISSSGLAPLKIGIDPAAFLEDHSGWDFRAPLIISQADVLRVFKLMLQIAMSMNGHEHVEVEAVAIMMTIVVRTDAYREREKFGDTTVFEAVAVLLKKEAGLRLQEMALHLLYLLLNCPKLLAAFCSGFKDSNSAGAPNAGANTASACLSFGILDGLGMCISCCRNSAQGLHLCRRAIVVLAFLASSGKSGFEILLIHKLPNRANFLGLILRVLVSEVDAESSENCTEPAISRERTLLMREALILLNRLASHHTYAPAVLKVLTSYGDMASLSIDIANRLSRRKSKFGQKCDDVTKQMREFEIVDLARVFRKRIFLFLGESI